MRRWTPAVRLALLLTVPLALMLIPTPVLERGPELCLFKRLFGVECPGCGMTRAVSSVFRGDLAAAWHYNWKVIIALPILTGVWVTWVRRDVQTLSARHALSP